MAPFFSFANVLLVVASIAVALALLEILFRVSGAEQRLFPRFTVSGPSNRIFYYENVGGGPVVVMVNVPGTTVSHTYPDDPRGYFGDTLTVDHRFNSMGFRGPDFKREKRKEVIRLAFLGDSFTLGQGVKFDDTFPALLSKDLNRLLAGSGRRVECYNFGVGGSNAVNTAVVLEMFALGATPDMVVLGLGLNDVEPPIFDWGVSRGGLSSSRKKRILDPFEDPAFWDGGRFLGVFAMYRILGKSLASVRSPAVQRYREMYGEANREWRDRNLRAIERMATRCSQEGVPFRVLILPVLYRLDDYPLADIHAFLQRFMEERRIVCIDLAEAFRGTKDRDLWVHRSDPHPNERAHAVIAREILERIWIPWQAGLIRSSEIVGVPNGSISR